MGYMGYIGIILKGIYRDDGKGNGNYYSMRGYMCGI